MSRDIAYPDLHGASIIAGLRLQPILAPELAPAMQALARWSCRRVGMPAPHGVGVGELMRMARSKPAEAARKQALRAGEGKAKARLAWSKAYAVEYSAQRERMTQLFADGKWEDER